LDKDVIKGLVHITGGGFLENIPRILPEGVSVEITRGSWPELPIFGSMQKLGNVDEKEMFRTFNMGIGMLVICSADDLETVQEQLKESYRIGTVTRGNRTVTVS
jgi:phosphoribosylformylglycinamidine cyclo-ligase